MRKNVVPQFAYILLLAAFGGAADEAQEAIPDDVGEATIETEDATDATRYTPRQAAHVRFLDLLDQDRYADALLAARQVITLTQEEYGADSEAMIVPLTNLATTLVRVDELAEAEEKYETAILLIEKYDGFLSPRLANSLIGLGGVYNRTQRYSQAVVVFERALRTNHVNQGFTNTDQFQIRDGLTESYIGLRENDEANFHQETQLEINRRRFGMQSEETAGAYKKLGDWYARTGQVEPALESYSRADRIYRVQASNVLHQRVAALEALAQLYQRLGQLGTSSSVLRKALEIVDAEAETDFPLRARVLIDLGDLYTIFNKLESAAKRYIQAWADLSQEEEFIDTRDAYFDQPARVAGLRLASLAATAQAKDAPRKQIRDGYVLISYTVTPLGRVKDVKVIESDPPGVMDDRLVSLWQRSKFRPRYVDGNAVTTESLLLRHDFKYAVTAESGSGEEGGTSTGDLEYPEKQLD